MGRYGLSQIEPSHVGFNPLKHPWEASDSVIWSQAAPSTNDRALSYTSNTPVHEIFWLLAPNPQNI